ncbi:zinc-dependent alcohol dehydrogenase [Cohnella zeiphila]|uniref:Alcohol dehydrogenase catalytic domain-containing protein n=1 Tax=Cohnella zeiphila TaxID=2761120 RepID=A0A7X0VYQ0_9BACL|nr:alcohol dehydrogenase catalytic domain-containing protein [Cohnella zeiphila]MBB6734722.1 alcohol dehydrogenase catalytic domain-containing protein [Cohnella zeiphila]
MKAAIYEGNHVIRITEGTCVQPAKDEVQIAVSYAGICGTDLHLYHGRMDHRVTFPHVMGHEMSGIVRAAGAEVSHVAAGDRVVVMPLISCGECPACRAGHEHICQRLKFIGIETPGAFQSCWTVPAKTVLKIPDSLSLKLGALIEPLAVACHDVRIGDVKKGENAVILGGGPIGTLIALVAKANGANVLVSEINPYRIELLSKLGIATVNPKERDVAEYVEELTGGAGCDVVFEVTSSSAGARLMTQLPRTRGRIVVVGIFSDPPPVDLHRFFWRELKLLGARVYEKEDFERAIVLAASGDLPLEGLISDVYPLERLQDGFRQMESGAGVMKILLDCAGHAEEGSRASV